MSTANPANDTPFSAALKAAREAAGVRQMDLAKALKIHRALLSDVELGKRLAFKTDRTHQIALQLQADPVKLMALAAHERGIDAPTLEGLGPEDLQLVVSVVLALKAARSRASDHKIKKLHLDLSEALPPRTETGWPHR